MFVPGIYRSEDPVAIRSVVDQNPLALFITNGQTRPLVTHLPAIVDPVLPVDQSLTGATVIGHMNRANPHWKSLSDGQTAVLAFEGGGSYVTPICYPPGPAAPTWNFVAVELTGRIRLLPDKVSGLRVVRATAERLEASFGDGWQSESSHPYFEQIVAGIGAFELTVASCSAMFKLSQEKPPEVREQVIRWFEQSDRGTSRDLARTMRSRDTFAQEPNGVDDVRLEATARRHAP